MGDKQEQLETLREIRSLMERSSRFQSLSGLIGVVTGMIAILGIWAVYFHFNFSWDEPMDYRLLHKNNEAFDPSFYTFLIVDIAIIFILSLICVVLLTIRKTKQLAQPGWDVTVKRLVLNLFLPMLVGGLYCLILLYHGQIDFIAPVTMIFYGLALINASKYTNINIRTLGILEIFTGLVASIYVGYGLLFWAFGFGVIHIVYGIIIYFKYEK